MKWICAEPGLHLGFLAGSTEPAVQVKRTGREWSVYRGWHYTGSKAWSLGHAKAKAEGKF